MTTRFLNDHDLEQLTGCKRPSSQVRWLRSRRWPHEVNALGKPVVAAAEVERRLTGKLAQVPPPGPNWSALDR